MLSYMCVLLSFERGCQVYRFNIYFVSYSILFKALLIWFFFFICRYVTPFQDNFVSKPKSPVDSLSPTQVKSNSIFFQKIEDRSYLFNWKPSQFKGSIRMSTTCILTAASYYTRTGRFHLFKQFAQVFCPSLKRRNKSVVQCKCSSFNVSGYLAFRASFRSIKSNDGLQSRQQTKQHVDLQGRFPAPSHWIWCFLLHRFHCNLSFLFWLSTPLAVLLIRNAFDSDFDIANFRW